MDDHRSGTGRLLLLIVALSAPAAADATPTLELGLYDSSPPCELAVLVDDNGALKLESCRVRFYDLTPEITPAERTQLPRAHFAVLTSRNRVVAILPRCFEALELDSVNRDGTANWWIVEGELEIRFTGFPSVVLGPRGKPIVRFETVHVIPEGERLKIAYPKRGTLILKTVDVGAPFKVEAVVDLDGRRTAVVLVTDAGPRVIVVDTASNDVTEPPSAVDMDEDRVRAVAVRDGDGYLVAALLPTDYLNLGFTPTMANLRLRGVGEILALRFYRNAILMAVVKRGKDLLLVALDLVGWEIRELPTRKLREDDGTVEFVVDGPAPLLPALVRYDKRSRRITDVVKTSGDETEGARIHGVEFETLNTVNPGAHGGVEFDLRSDGGAPEISELGRVRMITKSGRPATGVLYRVETAGATSTRRSSMVGQF